MRVCPVVVLTAVSLGVEGVANAPHSKDRDQPHVPHQEIPWEYLALDANIAGVTSTSSSHLSVSHYWSTKR